MKLGSSLIRDLTNRSKHREIVFAWRTDKKLIGHEFRQQASDEAKDSFRSRCTCGGDRTKGCGARAYSAWNLDQSREVEERQ